MFRSHDVDPVTTRLANMSNARNTGSMFGFFNSNHAGHKSQSGRDSMRRDSRPLGQRLDDEEDLQLIRQRKWMQRYQVASLVVVVAMLFAWFVNQ